MKAFKTIMLFVIALLICFSCTACSSSSTSSSGGRSQYDRDADDVAKSFGTDSDKVKDSVGALGEAMR